LLDRIDLHVVLPPTDPRSLFSGPRGESSSVVRGRVTAARAIQAKRSSDLGTRLVTNATVPPQRLEAIAEPDSSGRTLLLKALDRLNLSARAYTKVLRVARTIADLEGDAHVRASHIGEALGFRSYDRAASSGSIGDRGGNVHGHQER
jgi:magnesium chelatase family protein